MKNNGKNKDFFIAAILIISASMLAMSTNAIADNAEDKPAESPAVTVPSQMERFIKFQAIDSGMPYNMLRRTVTNDQLPLLYKLLDSNDYAPYWHNIARMIGYISNDPNSIPYLLNYFKRDDGARVESIAGKIYSIALIGKIGSDKATPILKKALTKEGAEELAKLWINEGRWKRSDRLGKDYVITRTQSAAIQGLVFTGKKENWDIIEKLYNEQKEISIKNQTQTDMMSSLVDAMAKKAFIADNNDVEAYFRLDLQAGFGPLKPYLDQYSLRNTLNKTQ